MIRIAINLTNSRSSAFLASNNARTIHSSRLLCKSAEPEEMEAEVPAQFMLILGKPGGGKVCKTIALDPWCCCVTSALFSHAASYAHR